MRYQARPGRILLGAAILAVTAINAGCGGMPSREHRITVDSEPRGAAVYASGVELGATPVTIDPSQAFPARVVGLSYRADGVLKLERAGCKTHTQRVDDAVIAKDIFVRLECQPGAAEMAPRKPAAESHTFRPAPRPVRPLAAPGASKPSRPQPAPAAKSGAGADGDAYAQRLRRVEKLREQGLISEQEYQQLRRKILNEL